ncbi:MAG: sugar phosphate isomerase/epimerase [Deltaproteobacteria bacterium]|nr:sugar phosphate isomerase/epimerase [Deltaproteobacteria bacterium]MCB9489226.1 sugar phosphate isomerase/epimerase [Deltaproteobacteria bacterium]
MTLGPTKLGLSTHCFAYRPIHADYFAWIRDAGFTAIELWCMAPHVEIEIAGSVAYFGKRAKAAGLDILSVHLPFYNRFGDPDFHYLNLGDPDRERAREARNRMLRVIAQMPEIGADRAVVHGIANMPGDPDQIAGWYVEDLAVIADEAANRGVMLAMENIMTEPSKTAPLAGLIDKLDHAHVRCCLDVGHANVNENAVTAVETLGERIISMHLHDNRGEHDEHLVPGDGTIDWPALVNAVKTHCPHTNLIYEINFPFARDETDPADVAQHLRRARERAREHWGL